MINLATYWFLHGLQGQKRFDPPPPPYTFSNTHQIVLSDLQRYPKGWQRIGEHCTDLERVAWSCRELQGVVKFEVGKDAEKTSGESGSRMKGDGWHLQSLCDSVGRWYCIRRKLHKSKHSTCSQSSPLPEHQEHTVASGTTMLCVTVVRPPYAGDLWPQSRLEN